MPTCSRQTLVKDHAFLVKKNKLTLLKLTLIDRRLNVIAKITFQEIAQLQNYRNSAMSISVYSVFFRRGISLYLLIERIFFIPIFLLYLKSATYRVSWEFTCKTTKILLLYIFLGHNRNVVNTKFPYPIKRLEVIRWFNQKSMVFNQSLS